MNNKHKWYEVDSGFGIRCEKCYAYTSKLFDYEFSKTKAKENCPVPDEVVEQNNSGLVNQIVDTL